MRWNDVVRIVVIVDRNSQIFILTPKITNIHEKMGNNIFVSFCGCMWLPCKKNPQITLIFADSFVNAEQTEMD
jgi:hypothetical protein